MTRIAIAGAGGRMGRALIDAAVSTPGVTLAAAFEREGAAAIGRDAGTLAGREPLGVVVCPATDAAGGFDVLIDFTAPEATLAHVRLCRGAAKRMVIGTTGLDDAQLAAVREAGREIGIVFSPNMSVGVNLCFRLTELAARTLGPDIDIEIVEAHHAAKRDAPSGTALRLGAVVAAAQGRELSECAVYTRAADTGPRRPGSIGFSTIRAGDIIGEHTVLFAAAGERVEITHRATSRANFAVGALRAAAWVSGRGAGLYDMLDVLGLK
jgi:4-hydroxy-tetrahydrodipicolinate reductase